MSDQSSAVDRGITVRDAVAEDMPAIAAIYGCEVETGVATFEEEAPSPDELERRRQGIVAMGLPYIVATTDGQVAGYCYASSYRPRPAYRYTVENTVYVARSARGRGVAEVLLRGLVERCEAAGRRQMMAVIAITGDPAESPSVALHAKLGFRRVGTVEGAGFKLGRWVDTVLMQRPLGSGTSTLPDAVRPVVS